MCYLEFLLSGPVFARESKSVNRRSNLPKNLGPGIHIHSISIRSPHLLADLDHPSGATRSKSTRAPDPIVFSKHLYLFREIPSESRQTLLSIGARKIKLFTIQKGYNNIITL